MRLVTSGSLLDQRQFLLLLEVMFISLCGTSAARGGNAGGNCEQCYEDCHMNGLHEIVKARYAAEYEKNVERDCSESSLPA
mmetsp:Transcript_98072/g.169976  ORF Transcript_98072/g.169976 Transcript_98072/m.169976 type:complete len:81 (+) Transcript_98072:1807-2049(+)